MPYSGNEDNAIVEGMPAEDERPEVIAGRYETFNRLDRIESVLNSLVKVTQSLNDLMRSKKNPLL